jgi:hypothetical protein
LSRLPRRAALFDDSRVTHDELFDDLELPVLGEGGADGAQCAAEASLLDARFSVGLEGALARGEGLLDALDYSEALSLSIALEASLTPPPSQGGHPPRAHARPHTSGDLPLPPLRDRLTLLSGGPLPPSLEAALELHALGEVELARSALGAGRAASYLAALCDLESGALRDGVARVESALSLEAPSPARALLYALAADLYDALHLDHECERCLMELLSLDQSIGAPLYSLLRGA